MAEATMTDVKPDQAERPTPEPAAPDQAPEQAARVGTALAVARAGTMQQAFAGLMPTTIGEAFQLSTYLARGGAIPSSLNGKAEAVMTVILAGMELGLTPIRAIQSISNISGTLCMKADLQLALTKRAEVLAFYDEGFEEKGKTDGNLKRRIMLALAHLNPAKEAVELAFERILSAIQAMPEGKPYGWAMGARKTDMKLTVRTFTWSDAETAVIYEKDEGGNGPRQKKKLSEKFNYLSFPGDMYPKRARTRLLQILAPDVTAGLPAVEQLEGGQVIDADFTVTTTGPAATDIDSLLADMRDIDLDAATTIEGGFRQLAMGKAQQVQKLTEYKGKPKDLVLWLKDEYARRRGTDGVKRSDVLDGEVVTDKAEPAKAAEPPKTEQQAPPAAAEPATPAEPAATVAATGPTAVPSGAPSAARTAAQRMKSSLKTF